MNKEDKSTAFDIFEKTGFYSTTHNKGLNSGGMKDALYELPKTIAKISNPLLSLPPAENEESKKNLINYRVDPLLSLPPTENEESEEESDQLQGERMKIFIPSNIIDIWTRLEVLLGLKLSEHTDTLTEASDLIDELYKRGQIQNEQHYRDVLDKIYTN